MKTSIEQRVDIRPETEWREMLTRRKRRFAGPGKVYRKDINRPLLYKKAFLCQENSWLRRIFKSEKLFKNEEFRDLETKSALQLFLVPLVMKLLSFLGIIEASRL
jgi:hypothetical protein